MPCEYDKSQVWIEWHSAYYTLKWLIIIIDCLSISILAKLKIWLAETLCLHTTFNQFRDETFRSWAYFEQNRRLFCFVATHAEVFMGWERDCLSLSATSLLIQCEKRANHCQNETITAINLQSIKNSIIEIPTHSSILNFGFWWIFIFVWELLR